ncbi:hypothetical protein FOL47_011247 [Perkinsus chesapeaki]|uniref:Uncharacterized protein n=1 Tax=Perkinsus chesapeaki TaxID=330153 RepID=A0A7J6MNC5_PERCH|nr:hypothetical protein FOL47_011247 [Perkinsus chesapeaki]
MLNLHLLLWLCSALFSRASGKETLKKVIAQLEEFDEPVFSKYGAALSRIGLAENWESGNYLREQYGHLLPKSGNGFVNDGSSFFFAERMDRNVASLLSLIQGLYPEGTGQPGYLKSRPNIVPIMTTMHNLDTIMNLPRDGPCKSTYQQDRKKWEAEHVPELRIQQKDLLSKVSAACGVDMTSFKKPLTWTIKNIADAFSFARNEGLDYDINSTLSHDVIQQFIDLSHQLVTEEMFGTEQQVTYWMGRMPEILLRLARRPDSTEESKSTLYWPIGLKMLKESKADEPWSMTAEEYWDRLKIGVFLNHRELMMAIAKMLEIDDVVKKDLPAGSMFVFEVYDDDDSAETSLKMKFWKPTQPSTEQKHRGGYVDGNLLDFYSTGSATEVVPKLCVGKAKCMWSDYRRALEIWTGRTGTWEDVCNATAAPYGPPQESFLDDDGDDFVAPHEQILQHILYSSDRESETMVHDPQTAAAEVDFDTVLA